MSDPNMKLKRKLRNRMRLIEQLKIMCQKLSWAVISNSKVYSDDPTIGYVVGDPEWVQYVGELMEEDLKKSMAEEAPGAVAVGSGEEA